MIDGLKLDVPGADIQAHIAERVTHHREKAEAYRKQAAGLNTLMADQPQQSADPRQAFASHEVSHTNRAEYFAFLGKYINPTETYRLTQDDLRTLEYVSRGY